MSTTYKSPVLFCLLAWALPLLSADFSRAQAGQWKFEAQLVWATNDKISPDPKHKKVEPEIQQKLDKLPLKWANYFEVNRQEITLDKGGTNKVCLSPKCNLEIKVIQGKKVEVSLLNKKGEVLSRQTQPLPKGEVLVLGGEAPNATAWFVTLKRIED
jgi:hypothetical protein